MITFFAHSISEDNEARVNSGGTDPSLSEAGVQKALELREFVKQRTFDVVFTSDL